MNNDMRTIRQGSGGIRTVARLFYGVVAFYLCLSSAVVQAQFTIAPQPYWAAWENLGGTTFFGPECISTQPNNIECLTIGYGAQVGWTQWNGNGWNNPPTPLP